MKTYTVILTLEEIHLLTQALVHQVQGHTLKHALGFCADQECSKIVQSADLGQRLCELVDPSLKAARETEGFSE